MLTLKNVSFRVDSGDSDLGIVNDVSFTLEDGKFLVITGPNGGGKSTLARLIMGIDMYTSGQILFNGEDITEKGFANHRQPQYYPKGKAGHWLCVSAATPL